MLMGRKLNFVVRTDDCYLRALGTEKHGIHRNRHLVYIGADGEMHLAK